MTNNGVIRNEKWFISSVEESATNSCGSRLHNNSGNTVLLVRVIHKRLQEICLIREKMASVNLQLNQSFG